MPNFNFKGKEVRNGRESAKKQTSTYM